VVTVHSYRTESKLFGCQWQGKHNSGDSIRERLLMFAEAVYEPSKPPAGEGELDQVFCQRSDPYS
jgi:hypothetical protein